MSLTYPLIAWGTPDDISAFSQSGTATVTSGITDPFGGTSAYLVDDNDAGAVEYRYKAVTFLGASVPLISLFVKQGTATPSDFSLFDTTFATSNVTLRLNWIAGVPSTSVIGGSGTALTPILLDNSWYLIRFFGQLTVPAHSYQLRLYGASSSTVGAVGNTNYYLQNSVVLFYPNNVLTWAEPRTGSVQAQSVAGTEDAWTLGTDYRLDFEGCWIPSIDLDDPPISGYAGLNESTGVNLGVEAMLKAGRDKQILTLGKDRTQLISGGGFPTSTMSVYLVSPMQGPGTLEPNGMIRYALSFRSSTSFSPLWP